MFCYYMYCSVYAHVILFPILDDLAILYFDYACAVCTSMYISVLQHIDDLLYCIL